MGYVVIAPVGDNPKALFVGMKEFPTSKVILLTPKKNIKVAKKLQRKLDSITVDSEINEFTGNLMEAMFREFGIVCSKYKDDRLLVNVATGDKMSSCAALSASFANGLRAFGINEGEVVLLPIMKLSYYQELSESKLKILSALQATDSMSASEIAEKISMKPSLVSYHLNGNHNYKGLKTYRLVEIEEGNSAKIRLSKMGNLLLKGYISK
jgi:DNA-binding transcriptional ArsR family regulator